jgi:hypothetical protein
MELVDPSKKARGGAAFKISNEDMGQAGTDKTFRQVAADANVQFTCTVQYKYVEVGGRIG